MMNRKGYVYTVISMMLILVLLAVVSLYYDTYKSSADLSPTKLRTDKLHYFVESAKKDTGRAMTIAGRRAAAYLTDYAINNHTALADASGTLKELMVNGTINTVPYAPMQNQTLQAYLNNLQTIGNNLGFTTRLSLRTIDLYTYDSLHFLVVAKYNYSIIDEQGAEAGVCGYENENQTMYVMIPIDGLEDPLYALNTSNKISRTINHSTQNGIQVLANANMGNGTGGGVVKDLSSLSVASQSSGIDDYNTSSAYLVPYTVFVINVTSIQFTGTFSDPARTILNNSGGAINYQPQALINGFPYVSGNITSTVNFTDKDYVIIKNVNGTQHQVLYPWLANDIKNKLYANSTNGSSFFDRLEGRGNLTNKSRNQAAAARALLGQGNSAPIGLESYVNITDLNQSGLYADINPYLNYSSVDYQYFQNTSGKWVYGTPYWFRMGASTFKAENLTDYCYDDYAAIWHFDEGAGAAIPCDGSRNAHALTLTGTNTRIEDGGKSGSCLYLGGNSDEEADASVNVSETAYTIGIWFKKSADLVDGGIYSTDAGTKGSNSDRNIYVDGSGNLCADLWGTLLVPICTSGTAYNDDTWHYVVHVYGGSVGAQKLYVDGIQKNNNPGTLTYSNRTAQTTVRIGYSSIPTTNTNFLGWIDDVKIWNRALSDAEIWDEYQKLL